MFRFVCSVVFVLAISVTGQQHDKRHQELINQLTYRPNNLGSSSQRVQFVQQKLGTNPIAGNEAIQFPLSNEQDTRPFANPPVPPPAPATPPTNTERRIATSSSPIPVQNENEFSHIRDFSWSLFQGSKLPSSIGNLVISPIQPQFLLSLLRTAAAGNTENEIARTIREVNPRVITDLISQLKHQPNAHTELGVANAMFTADSFHLNNSFIREAHTRDVEIIPVNFNSVEESGFIINNWIANATKNQIASVYRADALRGTRLLLANTIYFRSQWKYVFTDVSNERFETTEKLAKTIPMMRTTLELRAGGITLQDGTTKAQFIELPYDDENFSMILILPEQRHRLDDVIRLMTANDFAEILDYLHQGYQVKRVHLKMPKFSIQTKISLVNVLLKMGIVDLFSQTAKLPFFTHDRFESPLRVDDILQQCILNVDEKGTTAASATISHVVTLSLNSVPENIRFNLDQPFLSIIVDKRYQVPLFISKIFDP